VFVFLVGCVGTRPPTAQSRASEVREQPDIGVILSLADFHFDPFYDPTLFQELVQSPASEWPRIFAGSQVSGYGEYGKDSNYNLFVSALNHAALAAPKADFIMLAGDWLAHDLRDVYYQYAGKRDAHGLYQFIDKTIAFLTQRIREQFPTVPIYPALGNVDSYCGDYELQPKGAFLRRTAETWKGLLHNRTTNKLLWKASQSAGTIRPQHQEHSTNAFSF
jgi:hypothetical protein